MYWTNFQSMSARTNKSTFNKLSCEVWKFWLIHTDREKDQLHSSKALYCMLLTVLVGRGSEIGRRASCIVQKLFSLFIFAQDSLRESWANIKRERKKERKSDINKDIFSLFIFAQDSLRESWANIKRERKKERLK